MKRGQVALYLVMTLVAVVFLVLMNVGAYLGVRAKNRAMNAGDAAALAVAKWQGLCLNRIGAMNLEHLKAALDNDEERCMEIPVEQARICLLDPLHGIIEGNAAALKNGANLWTWSLRNTTADMSNRSYATNSRSSSAMHCSNRKAASMPTS
jgi:hypothetical protein